jgi:cysteine desulfurase
VNILIYLDYAATTPVDAGVLETFNESTIKYFANPNTSHQLGNEAFARIRLAEERILSLLGLSNREIVFTSGASEANNLAITGYAQQNIHGGRHIITTFLEHSSVTGPFMSLKDKGYDLEFVDIDKNGRVDPDSLRSLLRQDTSFVSICLVDSETGIIQDIDAIAREIKKYPNCIFHVDATQAIGKIDINLQKADLITFSAHKFYGINGCGALIKTNDISLEPQIKGGLSLTPYRSGTPSVSLITSMERALIASIEKLESRKKIIKALNNDLKEFFQQISSVKINSTSYSISNILNVSIDGIKGEDVAQHLSDKGIYLSAKSACSAPNTPSRSVYAITRDKKRALSSFRISLSHLTTSKELEVFKNEFINCIDSLI